MNNKYGRPLPCHLISTETAIEVEYWEFAVKNVVTKIHGFMTRRRVIKAQPVRATGTEQLWRHVFQPLMAILDFRQAPPFSFKIFGESYPSIWAQKRLLWHRWRCTPATQSLGENK
jgi:hypothetical protein